MSDPWRHPVIHLVKKNGQALCGLARPWPVGHCQISEKGPELTLKQLAPAATCESCIARLQPT
jgi:hypothetical protein